MYQETFIFFFYIKLFMFFILKLEKNEVIDEKEGSYERLNKFMWERAFINKVIMTMPYNVTSIRVVIVIRESLIYIDCNKDKCLWYSDMEKKNEWYINHKDVR